MKLPDKNRDLRRYVLKKWTFRFTAFFLWMSFCGMGAYSYNQAHETYPREELVLGWKLAVFLLITGLIGFFVFRISEFRILKTLEGKIEDSDISHTYSSSQDPGFGSASKFDFRTRTHLKIRTAEGKLYTLRFEQKPGYYLYYYPGSIVCRFGGLPYPLADPNRTVRPEIISHTEEDGETPIDDLSCRHLCIACGRLNRNPDLPCEVCGMTLVSPNDVWKKNRF